MKLKKNAGNRLLKIAAGFLAMGIVSYSAVNATEIDYHPAWLVEGNCGHGSVVVKLDGKRHRAQCANIDTYTGRGYFDKESCYRVEHGAKYDKDKHHQPYSHNERGYYKHCIVRKQHFQLPVIKVEKRAYDEHRRLIPTSKSPTYDFHISTNGGYDNSFKLKSRQKFYAIPAKDTYTIAENARGYRSQIRCNSHTTNGYKVDVKIDKPGMVVGCTFSNYKREVSRPKACVADGRTLTEAQHNYAAQCHQPRKDCDPHGGKWYCSSEQIGDDAPTMSSNDGKTDEKPEARACVASGHTLNDAKAAYARQCHLPRRDCDPIDGNWYCSSEQIGSDAPALAIRN